MAIVAQFSPEDGVRFILDAVVPSLPSRQLRRAVLEVRATVAQVAELDAALGARRTDVEILGQALERLGPVKDPRRVLGAKEAIGRALVAAQEELARMRAQLDEVT